MNAQLDMMGRPGGEPTIGVLLVLVVLAVFAAPDTRAFADPGLTVSTEELGGWPATVASLESDVNAEGRTVHVVVSDGGAPLPCNAYRLALEPPGDHAFNIGACSNDATKVTLLHRSALFAHDGPLPRPLAVPLIATQERTTRVTGGASSNPVSVECGIALRPAVTNMETGARTMLLPDRYTLHAWVHGEDGDGTALEMQPIEGGWQVHGRRAFTVDYAVTDSVSGRTVLSDQATLTCGRPVDATDAAPPAFDIDPSSAQSWPGPNGPPGACPNAEISALLADLHELAVAMNEAAPADRPALVENYRDLERRAAALIGPRYVTPTMDCVDEKPAHREPPSDGGYIATNVFSSLFITGSVVGAVAGGFMMGSANHTTADVGGAMLATAPHVLVTGLVMACINVSNHHAALAQAAALSWAPYATPQAGGAVVGVGHVF